MCVLVNVQLLLLSSSFLLLVVSVLSTLSMQLIFILFYLLLNDRAGFTWRPQCLPYR